MFSWKDFLQSKGGVAVKWKTLLVEFLYKSILSLFIYQEESEYSISQNVPWKMYQIVWQAFTRTGQNIIRL